MRARNIAIDFRFRRYRNLAMAQFDYETSKILKYSMDRTWVKIEH